MNKDVERKAGFARRKTAFGTGLDGAAQRHLRQALAGFVGKPLAGYMPIRTEIDPLPVMADWGGPVGVPVIQGTGLPLDFHEWSTDARMVVGPFGAKVPASQKELIPEVLIVPLVAFDDNGYRLGYGGGFYDRTLEKLRGQRKTIAIGFAFSAQRADKVPTEPTDQRLDAMVTELGVRWF